jgi:phage repressor protein C with HTH and peptisase S24 domain
MINIKQSIESCGLSIADVARTFGLSHGAVSQWCTANDVPAPRAEKLARLLSQNGVEVSAFEISTNYKGIVKAKIPVFETKSDVDMPEPGDWTADLIDIELAAGAGAEAPEFVETKYRHTFAESWRVKMGIARSEKLYRMPVRGDSMEERIPDGSVVLVRPADKRVIDDKTYAIVVAGQQKVKKLRQRRDGGLEIVSNNPRYAVELVPANELDTVYIIGRVIDVSGPPD